MSKWVFVTGLPCVGKTTSLKRMAVHYGIDTNVQPFPFSVCQRSALPDTAAYRDWIVSELQAMWERYTSEAKKPCNRVFDLSPVCGLVEARVQAQYLVPDGVPRDAMAMDELTTYTLNLLNTIAGYDIDVHFVVACVRPNSPMRFLETRLKRHNHSQAQEQPYLILYNCVLHQFASQLHQKNKNPRVKIHNNCMSTRNYLDLRKITL